MTHYECRRALCEVDATDEHTPYCSDDCRKISTSLQQLPMLTGPLRQTPDTATAVVAAAFPWLDARAKAGAR